jgi:hypothetical protein
MVNQASWRKKRAKKTFILHDKLNELRMLYDNDVIISMSTIENCHFSSDAIKVMEMRYTCGYVCILPNFLLPFLLIWSAYRHKFSLNQNNNSEAVDFLIFPLSTFHLFNIFFVDIFTVEKMISTFCNFPFRETKVTNIHRNRIIICCLLILFFLCLNIGVFLRDGIFLKHLVYMPTVCRNISCNRAGIL